MRMTVRSRLRPKSKLPGTFQTYYPKDKDQFPEGSPIRQALEAGRTVTMAGTTVAWIQRKGEFYDLAGNRIDRSHLCGGPVKNPRTGALDPRPGKKASEPTPDPSPGGRLCQRKVKGLTGRCYQHQGS